jgi:ABC-type sugar transport system ATPase subunit
VTHDQVEALTMGDRVAVLKDGVLLQVDTANDLYEHPETVFVGEFIGSPKMNVVPGTLEVTGGQIFVECFGVRCDVSQELAGRLSATAANGPVLVGIRPHDLHIKGEAPSDGPTFQVTVDICEHTGTEIFATVEIGEAKLIARLPRSPMPQPGQRIDVAFNKERLHLFDVTSKESLLERDASREHVSVGSSEPVAEVQSS